MTRHERTDGAAASGADSGDEDAAAGPDSDPFATLGNETRLRIVDALYEHTEATGLNDGLSYSTLRERSGVADKGNFNYHLDVLRERFVEKVDDEYRLSFPGFEVVKAIRSGAWVDHEPRGPVEVEAASPLVGGDPLYASYADSLVTVHADEEPVFRIAVRPTGAAHRDLDDLVDVMATLLVEAIEKAQRGICPYCHAPPERAVTRSESGAETEPRPWTYCFVATCSECGPLFSVPVGFAVARHPAVVSFLWDHGVDARARRPWTLGLLDAAREVSEREEDPSRFRVTVEGGDEALEMTLDDEAQVLGTTRWAVDG